MMANDTSTILPSGSLNIVELLQRGKHSLKSKPLSNIHGRIQTKLKPFLFHVCKEKLLGVITQEVDVLQQNTDRSIIYVCSLEGQGFLLVDKMDKWFQAQELPQVAGGALAGSESQLFLLGEGCGHGGDHNVIGWCLASLLHAWLLLHAAPSLLQLPLPLHVHE